jgi:hypothetical protein
VKPAPERTWRVFPCEGGWYWETFCDGIKVNGGISANELYARLAAHDHLRGPVDLMISRDLLLRQPY